jgi:hypothetical protein
MIPKSGRRFSEKIMLKQNPGCHASAVAPAVHVRAATMPKGPAQSFALALICP